MLSYFLTSRSIYDSAIWRENPHVLKLFFYLIGNARFKVEPYKYPSFEVKRGEVLANLAEIADDNQYMESGAVKKWSRQKVSRMLHKLQDGGYIKILSDTYGTHISVTNYNTYQDPKSYRADGVGTGMEQSCELGVTGSSITKECIKGVIKETMSIKKNKQKEIPLFPDNSQEFNQAFEDFAEMRKNQKKPLTARAKELAFKTLQKLSNYEDVQIQIMEQSTMNCYQGLFPLKQNNNNSKPDKNDAFMNMVYNEKTGLLE